MTQSSNRPRLMRPILAGVVGLAALSLAAPASAGSSFCDEITSIARTGGVISSKYTNQYQATLHCVAETLPGFLEGIEQNENYKGARQDQWAYIALTGAAVSIFDRHGAEAIQFFRKHDSLNVAQVLAAGSRHRNRQIRINSANVFSNVIDNSTLCVALDYLNAPVRESDVDNSDIFGRANLLYVANVVSKWAYKENAMALGAVTAGMLPRVRSLNSNENLDNTLKGLNRIQDNLQLARDGGALLLPSTKQPYATTVAPDGLLDDCRNYKFKFWTSQTGRYFADPAPVRFKTENGVTQSVQPKPPEDSKN